MVQGLFGGCTSYREQSLPNILEDIDFWVKYTGQKKDFMIKSKNEMKSSEFWNKIPWNFQMTIETTIDYFETILYDLDLVKKAISANHITIREVSLLKSIGKKSVEYNREYGRHFNEDHGWRDYGNPDFTVVEQAYAKGRDFFVTLQDAANAAERLEDYMQNSMINNGIQIAGNVNASQIQQNSTNSNQTMINEDKFDYTKILEGLEKIQKSYKYEDFNNDFGAEAEKFKQATDELILMTKDKKEPEKIKKYLQFLQDVASKTASSVIATGILGIIQQLLK